jgi:HSP20 family protein
MIMANLIRREPATNQSVTRDPFQWMRDMLAWEPFREAAPSSWMGPAWEGNFNPAFEVKETKDGFQFKADLPGIKEADIDVKLTGNRLAISGKREFENQDKGDTFYTYERSYGTFQRVFALPDGIDAEHSAAELKDGVLTIVMPKKPSVASKTISVKTSDTPKS